MTDMKRRMMNDMNKEPARPVEDAGIEAPQRRSAERDDKRRVLREVTRQLELGGIDYVIGGSGMLLGLGLTDTVGDWDIMTEASEKEIRAALAAYTIVDADGPSDLYRSAYKLRLEEVEPEVEIIGGFAVRTQRGICRLPALPGTGGGDLRIASPEIWFAAYTLMGRTAKAERLEVYLQKHGADPSALAYLRSQPVPEQLAERLNRLPEQRR